MVAGGGGRHDAVVEAGAVGAGTATHQVVEAGGEGTGAVSSQLGQDQATVLVVGRRGQHAFAARDGGGTPQGPTGGQGGEIGCEKGVLGDRVGGRTAGGGGERPGNTCGERGVGGAGEDRRGEGEVRGGPRLGKTAGGGLDLPSGVFQRQVAAQRGGTGEVGAGGHIGAGQPAEGIDKGAAIGGAGHGAAVDEHVGAGCEGALPAGDLAFAPGEGLLVKELVAQQQSTVAAVADDAHHADAGAGLAGQVVADLVDHIVRGVEREDLRVGVFLNGHLLGHIGTEDRQCTRLGHQMLERRQCGGHQAVFQVLHHGLHLRVAGASLRNRADKPGQNRTLDKTHLYYPLFGKESDRMAARASNNPPIRP